MKVIEVPASFDLRDIRPVERPELWWWVVEAAWRLTPATSSPAKERCSGWLLGTYRMHKLQRSMLPCKPDWVTEPCVQ
jgi:hypothetical protein